MWVEVTFELFTTVVAPCFAVMLFFVYWIAKPTGVIVPGGVFSDVQGFPSILFTLDDWKHMQIEELGDFGIFFGSDFGIANFWNVIDAGLMGSMINLPAINCSEQATFFTGRHAHGTIFGAQGNIPLASFLFCV